MEVCDYYIQYRKATDKIKLYGCSDIHLGNINSKWAYFEKLMKQVGDEPNSYVILLGDQIEGIIPGSDKRFDLNSFDRDLMDPTEQRDKIIEILQPVKGKIICILDGNHEEKLRKFNRLNITEDIAKALETKNLGYNGFVTLHFGRIGNNGEQQHGSIVEIFATHGIGAGRLRGSKINRIEALANTFEADCYLAGHNHDLSATTNVIVSKIGNKIVKKQRFFGLTGSYLETYQIGTSIYSEKALYPALNIGSLVLHITPETKKIRGEELIF